MSGKRARLPGRVTAVVEGGGGNLSDGSSVAVATATDVSLKELFDGERRESLASSCSLEAKGRTKDRKDEEEDEGWASVRIQPLIGHLLSLFSLFSVLSGIRETRHSHPEIGLLSCRCVDKIFFLSIQVYTTLINDLQLQENNSINSSHSKGMNIYFFNISACFYIINMSLY